MPLLAAVNLPRMSIPAEHGGGGTDTLSCIIAVEEVARVSGSVALMIAAHNSLVVHMLNMFAKDAQKKKYVVPLARGDYLGAFGITDPRPARTRAAPSRARCARATSTWSTAPRST